MRKTALLVAIAALATAGVQFGARADHLQCESKVVIFSRPVAANAHGLRCSAEGGFAPELHDAPSTAFIHPRSTQVSVRFLPGAELEETLFVDLVGMGVVNGIKVPLVWTDIDSPADGQGDVYDSANRSINSTQSLDGCITASVYYLDEDQDKVEIDRVAFHGWAGSCS